MRLVHPSADNQGYRRITDLAQDLQCILSAADKTNPIAWPESSFELAGAIGIGLGYQNNRLRVLA